MDQCKHAYEFMETEERGEAKVDVFYCPICREFTEIIRNKDGSTVELEGWD